MGIILLCLLIAGVFVYTFNVFLLLMAAVVLAVYLRLIANKLRSWTGWKDGICFGLSILITLILLGGLSWLVGAKVEQQVTDLKDRMPQMKEKLSDLLDRYPTVKKFASQYVNFDSGILSTGGSESGEPNAQAGQSNNQQQQPAQAATVQQSDSAQQAQPDVASQSTPDAVSPGPPGTSAQPRQSGGQGSGVSGFISRAFSGTFGLLGDLYVLMFLGIFLGAAPREYVDGVVGMVPEGGQSRARKILESTGENLKSWFKGMTYSVLITFALTAIGLLIIGVDLWLILAIAAGLLTFIPNFGPIISWIPAVLVGFLDSPQTALWITVLYVIIQTVESNILTPMIQKKMINTPAALLLFFQMVMGALSSGWGVVMATPLLVVIMTVVQQLYLKEEPENQGE